MRDGDIAVVAWISDEELGVNGEFSRYSCGYMVLSIKGFDLI